MATATATAEDTARANKTMGEAVKAAKAYATSTTAGAAKRGEFVLRAVIAIMASKAAKKPETAKDIIWNLNEFMGAIVNEMGKQMADKQIDGMRILHASEVSMAKTKLGEFFGDGVIPSWDSLVEVWPKSTHGGLLTPQAIDARKDSSGGKAKGPVPFDEYLARAARKATAAGVSRKDFLAEAARRYDEAESGSEDA